MKTWFSYRHTRLATDGTRANPWKPMLRALRKPSGGCPKRPSLIQAYLSANKERVSTIYADRQATHEKKGIALRTIIAQELYDAEDNEAKAGWTARMSEYERADERYQEAKKGEPSNSPEDQKE